MLANQFLTADILDIIFEGRNKEYGAYALRKGYNSRMKISIGSMIAIVSGIISLMLVLDKTNGEIVKPFSTPYELIDYVVAVKKPPVPVTPSRPSAPKPKPPTIANVVPVIVKEEVSVVTNVPPIDQLDNAAVSTITSAGTGSTDNILPQAENGNAVKADQSTGPDIIYSAGLQVESEYPGGLNAWKRFLIKTFQYPTAAEESGVQGTVLVQFIVDTTGTVSDVHAISGPGELTKEAVRVISRSGKWTPAIQNGRKVKSYKSQGIVFRLSD